MKTESNLSSEILDAFGCPGDWTILHTLPRQEKALARTLSARLIPYYLPLRRNVRYHGKRKIVSETPLFPSYLFIKADLDGVYVADRTNRVASIIKCTDQKTLDWELQNINKALLQNAPFLMYPSLVKGIRVEVRGGPFRGLQGVIENRSKGDRLILQVETLGRAFSLELDGSLLDVVD